MLGAIIGDIVGSRFEFDNYRKKDFELFTKKCFATDDSIMTLAVAKAIMETEKVAELPIEEGIKNYDSILSENVIKYMQQIGRKYPYCGFGGMFYDWVFSKDPKPYNSFGNGSAMRISPVGFFARTATEVRLLSHTVTAVTHNHKEGIKGAEATAMAIFMARKGYTKEEIREEIEEHYYPLNFTIDEIRDTYEFNETCQDTVPQAIQAFLESTSFEDAIRTAISVGGDSDTLAAITCAIAEAYYGVPEDIKETALSYLDDELFAIYDEWTKFIGEKVSVGKFHVLTKYIEKLSGNEYYGKWFFDTKGDGTAGNPRQMPFASFSELTFLFIDEFYGFLNSHPEYELTNYAKILEKNGLKWDRKSMEDAPIDTLDEQCILALITGVIRAERLSEGTLLYFLQEGIISKWLKRLKDIDKAQDTLT